MKLFIYFFATLLIIVGLLLVGLSIASRKQPELGLVDGQLRSCPATPNCVCSEYPGKDAYIEPLDYSGSTEEALARLKRVIAETGGLVIAEEPGYLRAVYETQLLRFIDDMEFRQDKSNPVIHIRSASRVGHSDLGANRKRVEKIRAMFANNQD
jgi:uncharacterized protein (DUF1499 family)